MRTLGEHETLQKLPRQEAARERYYRLETRIAKIEDYDRLDRLYEKMHDICKRLKLHHTHRSYLEKRILTQRRKLDARMRNLEEIYRKQILRTFGPNLVPDPPDSRYEGRLLELIELRATCGISSLIGNCEFPYSYRWEYQKMFPRSHNDILHVPRKLHNLIKTKIKEQEK